MVGSKIDPLRKRCFLRKMLLFQKEGFLAIFDILTKKIWIQYTPQSYIKNALSYMENALWEQRYYIVLK